MLKDKQILLATRNRDKEAELKALLDEYHIEGIALNDLDPQKSIPDVEENGSTLRENAFIKARKIFSRTGIPTIADDTGLEVDALNGAPGVFSARYAGEDSSYADNTRKLLSELMDIKAKNRTAKFKTVACYVDGHQELWAEGIVEGEITEKPKGDNGFGYDPVFYIPECGKTYAQLTRHEKNRWSHRGKAMKQLFDLLYKELDPTEHPF